MRPAMALKFFFEGDPPSANTHTCILVPLLWTPTQEWVRISNAGRLPKCSIDRICPTRAPPFIREATYRSFFKTTSARKLPMFNPVRKRRNGSQRWSRTAPLWWRGLLNQRGSTMRMVINNGRTLHGSDTDLTQWSESQRGAATFFTRVE